MKIRKLNQKGFSHFEAIVLIVVLLVIGSVGTFVYSRMHKSHAGSNCKGQLLQVGSSGQCVKDAQILSGAFTGVQISINGSYGSTTKANILVFQKKAFPNAKTQWDGKVGPNTWGKLCSLIPLTKTQAVYNAQKDACGSTSFSVPVAPTSTNYGFYNPFAITTDTFGHVWVTDYNGSGGSGSSVTELNASDGSLVKVYNDASYGFDNPGPIAADKLGHVWVANSFGGNSVTELNASDGSLVKVYNDASYGFDNPYNITTDTFGHIWVVNRNSVTELNAKDGSLVKVYNDASYGFINTTAIAADSLGHIWVVSLGGCPGGCGAVTELDAKSGSLIKVYEASSKNIFYTTAIAADSLGHIWVVNSYSVTELNANNGSLVQKIE